MKTAVTILVLVLVLLNIGLLTACGLMNQRRKDDDADGCDKALRRRS